MNTKTANQTTKTTQVESTGSFFARLAEQVESTGTPSDSLVDLGNGIVVRVRRARNGGGQFAEINGSDMLEALEALGQTAEDCTQLVTTVVEELATLFREPSEGYALPFSRVSLVLGNQKYSPEGEIVEWKLGMVMAQVISRAKIVARHATEGTAAGYLKAEPTRFAWTKPADPNSDF